MVALSDNIVWLIEERTFAHLLNLGAFCSIVRYTRSGIDFEVVIENDEFVFREDAVIFEHTE